MAYIDKEKLLEGIEELKQSPWYNDDFGGGTKQARQEGVNIVVDMCIKYAPTEDVVVVVRCKDCKHKVDLNGKYLCGRNGRIQGNIYLNMPQVAGDHFCGYGERKPQCL